MSKFDGMPRDDIVAEIALYLIQRAEGDEHPISSEEAMRVAPLIVPYIDIGGVWDFEYKNMHTDCDPAPYYKYMIVSLHISRAPELKR